MKGCRAAAIATTLFVGACGAFTALGGGDDGDSPGAAPGDRDATSDAGVADSGTDAPSAPGDGGQRDAIVCAQNDEACDSGAQCCSGHCTEQRVCAATCIGASADCTYAGGGCCVGLSCDPQLPTAPYAGKCQPCLPSGQQAPVGAQILFVNRCCSREASAFGACQ